MIFRKRKSRNLNEGARKKFGTLNSKPNCVLEYLVVVFLNCIYAFKLFERSIARLGIKIHVYLNSPAPGGQLMPIFWPRMCSRSPTWWSSTGSDDNNEWGRNSMLCIQLFGKRKMHSVTVHAHRKLTSSLYSFS